jgi:hypothetical protein
MLCSRPFYFKRLLYGGQLVREEYPCGQCSACRLNRSRGWVSRLVMEAVGHDATAFATLTYDDGEVPQTRDGRLTLRPVDVQLWQKRIRTAYPLPLRFFVCGEYGDRTGRPHYHAMVYGLHGGEAERQLLHSSWGKGFTMLGTFAFEGAKYVTSYVMKGARKRAAEGDPDAPVPEFARMSLRPGLGVPGLEGIRRWLYTRPGAEFMGSYLDVPQTVMFQGRRWPLGRYLVTRLRSEFGLVGEQVEDARARVRSERAVAEQSVPGWEALRELVRDTHYERSQAMVRTPRGIL